ncbi:hypothetical protein ACFQU7_35225 [Pseudoroseomonas wenyumeiae]
MAERMQGASMPCFLAYIDQTLGQLQALLLDEGLETTRASEICRTARQIAQEERRGGASYKPPLLSS